jgi:hypothetical protein
MAQRNTFPGTLPWSGLRVASQQRQDLAVDTPRPILENRPCDGFSFFAATPCDFACFAVA